MPNACVIGLGRSGVAAARLLQRQGWQVTVSDSGSADSLLPLQQKLNAEGIAVKLGDRFTPNSEMQRVVVSPGVPWDLPALVKARELGIETIGEVELAWQSLSQIPWVSVTGTNGKTTTTALIAAIFQAAGLKAPACGNIGYAVGEVALQALSESSSEPPDWVIAELSSYQIEAAASIAPQIGVWTTLTADHLSRHYTLENYAAIKAKLLAQSQLQVLNGDDAYLRQMAASWPNAHWTSITGKADLLCAPERGAYIEDGWAIVQCEPIVAVADLKMIGSHNQQNLLMALLTARLAGIPQAAIVEAIQQFPGVPHRLERVYTWRKIDFINDSKATNYDAAQVGLASVAAPSILIAGGEAKAGDDALWMQTICERAAVVLLIGKAAPTFAQRFEQIGQPYEIVETMAQAVRRGAVLAEQLGAQNVLLSPACASFDQYSDFEQRGAHFGQLCQEILGQEILGQEI